MENTEISLLVALSKRSHEFFKAVSVANKLITIVNSAESTSKLNSSLVESAEQEFSSLITELKIKYPEKKTSNF